MGDHDSGYKLIFNHPVMIQDLLMGFVKEDWVRQLDFTTLEKVNNSYVADDLRDRVDDIVWKVRWGAGWLFIYLILEFQSTVDWLMAVRLQGYLSLLYQDLIRSGQIRQGEMLPPVLPMVLYNGRPEWTAMLDIADMIHPSPAGLDRFRPRMGYLLVDEVRLKDSDLALQQNLVAALFRLEKSRTAQEIRLVVGELIEWLRSPEQLSLRRAFAVWLGRVLLPRRVPGQTIHEVHDLQEVDTMLAETVQEWTREWEQRGLEKGLKMGLEQGLERGLERGLGQGLREGAVRVLHRLIKQKWGDLCLPPELEERLGQATLDEIETWTDRVLGAESVREVFA